MQPKPNLKNRDFKHLADAENAKKIRRYEVDQQLKELIRHAKFKKAEQIIESVLTPVAGFVIAYFIYHFFLGL